ncbi:hypothetical protein BC628DRAFT_1418393 [Trametes gibbosa]|nr:hypothetical protein BC628DRAFT_1418393 [Trametes gibbosa]
MTSTSTSTLSTTLSTPDFTFTLPSASASTTAIPNTLSTDSAHVLSDGAIAAIAVCSTLGVAIIVSLLWLARRGTFGSGRLFGVGLGAARYATTWRGAAGRGAGGGDKGAGAVPVLPGEAGYVVTPFVSPPESTVGDAMGLDSAVAVSPTTPSSRSLTEFATPLMASASHFGGSSTYTDFTPPGLARAPSTYKSPPLSSAVVGSAPAVSLPQLDVSQLPSVHTPVAPHTYSDLEHNADEAEALWPQARARRQSQDGGIRLEGGPLDLHEVLPPAYDG